MPITWPPAKRRQKNTDARWTTKHGKSCYGYKVSADADKCSKLVRKIKVSAASEHDTRHFEDVLDPYSMSRDILADKGYVDVTGSPCQLSVVELGRDCVGLVNRKIQRRSGTAYLSGGIA